MDYLLHYLERIKLNNIKTEYNYLDLRGTPCPLNFVRCSLAIENLEPFQYLKVDIDRGESEDSILSGLSKNDFKITILFSSKEFLTLKIDPFVNK